MVLIIHTYAIVMAVVPDRNFEIICDGFDHFFGNFEGIHHITQNTYYHRSKYTCANWHSYSGR